jgi:YVTN family beta-propeller protein
VAIAITPDSKTAYVPNEGSGTVTPITTATNTPGSPIPVGLDPHSIVITPDGKTAYVGDEGDDEVTPIATATNTAGPPIRVDSPRAFAFTPIPHRRAPAFTSHARYKATAGVAFSFTVTASGTPPPTITEAGKLPPGVKFKAHSDGTATISGRPHGCNRKAYRVKLTATNQYGTAVQAFTLSLTGRPRRGR